MDCNKEEAARAKKIAEEKMKAGDFVGAHKFVTKAQRLFPNLENIMQMTAICDVHSSANKKINGIIENWYGILQVEPFADADTIKKQYRKLTLLLHPDKNKFAGAEAAFKLVGEANRLFADQIQRSQYDLRYTSHSNLASKHSNAKSGRNSWENYARVDTFSTCCANCGHEHRYSREHMNRIMRCSICQKIYVAYNKGDEEAETKKRRTSAEEFTKKDADDEYNNKRKKQEDDLKKNMAIHEWLEKTSQKVTEIRRVTGQWNNMPDELKRLEVNLVGKGQGLARKEEQQRRRSQELQTKAESISEIETLQRQIAEYQGSKANLTLRATQLENESVRTQQRLDTLVSQNTRVKQGLRGVQNQVGDKKAELELTKNSLASTTRHLDDKKERLEAVDGDLRRMEQRNYYIEEREKEVKKRYEDDKNKLKKIQGDLDYTRNHQERLLRKLDDNLYLLDEANKSIHTFSTQF